MATVVDVGNNRERQKAFSSAARGLQNALGTLSSIEERQREREYQKQENRKQRAFRKELQTQEGRQRLEQITARKQADIELLNKRMEKQKEIEELRQKAEITGTLAETGAELLMNGKVKDAERLFQKVEESDIPGSEHFKDLIDSNDIRKTTLQLRRENEAALAGIQSKLVEHISDAVGSDASPEVVEQETGNAFSAFRDLNNVIAQIKKGRRGSLTPTPEMREEQVEAEVRGQVEGNVVARINQLQEMNPEMSTEEARQVVMESMMGEKEEEEKDESEEVIGAMGIRIRRNDNDGFTLGESWGSAKEKVRNYYSKNPEAYKTDKDLSWWPTGAGGNWSNMPDDMKEEAIEKKLVDMGFQKPPQYNIKDLVERPSRYIGNAWNWLEKNKDMSLDDFVKVRGNEVKEYTGMSEDKLIELKKAYKKEAGIDQIKNDVDAVKNKEDMVKLLVIYDMMRGNKELSNE